MARERRRIRSALPWLRMGLQLGVPLLILSSALRVGAQAPLQLIVRVTSDAERELLTRVRGQLSDVDATLIVVEAALEATFRDQLEAARRLCEQHHASVVVWFDVQHVSADQSAREVIVHIATPATDRVATRRLQAQSEPDASGLLEGAALVVRSATRALSDGGVIGVSRERAIAESLASTHERDTGERHNDEHDTDQHARASTRAAQPEVDETAAAASTQDDDSTAHADEESAAVEQAGPSVSTPLRVQGLGFIGARVLVDQVSPVGHWGAHLHAGIALGSIALLARGTWSVPSPIDVGPVDMRLARHAVGGAIGVVVAPSRRWQLLLLAHGSAVLSHRSTQRQDAATSTTSATLVNATLGPAFVFSFLPGAIGVSCELGLDVMPTPPSFIVAGVDAPAPVTLARVQPYASIGVGARLP